MAEPTVGALAPQAPFPAQGPLRATAPTTPNGSTPAGQDALKEAQAKVAALEAQLNAQAAKPKGKPLPAGAVSALLA